MARVTTTREVRKNGESGNQNLERLSWNIADGGDWTPCPSAIDVGMILCCC